MLPSAERLYGRICCLGPMSCRARCACCCGGQVYFTCSVMPNITALAFWASTDVCLPTAAFDASASNGADASWPLYFQWEPASAGGVAPDGSPTGAPDSSRNATLRGANSSVARLHPDVTGLYSFTARRASPLLRRASPPLRRASPTLRRASPPLRRVSPLSPAHPVIHT